MTNNDIPEFLLTGQDYTVKSEKDIFLTKSIKRILQLLSIFKKNEAAKGSSRVNTVFRIIGVLIAVMLTACAKNFYFVFIMLALSVVLLALSSGDVIKRVFKVLIPAQIMSAIIILPSFLLGDRHTLISIAARLFVTITLIIRLSAQAPWSKITSSLHLLRVPDIIIFTIDLTIQYIYILSQVCYEMLTALRVRSIGTDSKKQKSLSGIIGTAFIKARENADKTSAAMECRGFDGTFGVKKQFKASKYDITYLTGVAAIAGIFIYFQVVIK